MGVLVPVMSDPPKPPRSDPSSVWSSVARMEAEINDPEEADTNIYTPDMIQRALDARARKAATQESTAVIEKKLTPARRRLLEQADTEIGPVPELVRPRRIDDEHTQVSTPAPSASPQPLTPSQDTLPSAAPDGDDQTSMFSLPAERGTKESEPRISIHTAPSGPIEESSRSGGEVAGKGLVRPRKRARRSSWAPFALLIVVGFALGYLVVTFLR
jgi:hypothetical protein